MFAIDALTVSGLLLAFNLLVFGVYLADKQAARVGRRRISERTLLTLALLGGSPGAISAQRLLRHKTQKEPFRSILTAIAGLHAVMLAGFAILLLGWRSGLL